MNFTNISARLWNVLVLNIDVDLSMTIFKRNLKTYLLHNSVILKYTGYCVCIHLATFCINNVQDLHCICCGCANIVCCIFRTLIDTVKLLQNNSCISFPTFQFLICTSYKYMYVYFSITISITTVCQLYTCVFMSMCVCMCMYKLCVSYCYIYITHISLK